MAYVIQVTAEDIKNGKRHESNECPIALALIRNGCTNVCVGVDRLSDGLDWYKLPRSVQARVRRFDDGAKIRPFVFELTDKDMMYENSDNF